MSTTQTPKGNDETAVDDPGDTEIPPIPDERGPHDVPDDTVIEKTLPSPPDPGAK